jgi:hypothetical protein
LRTGLIISAIIHMAAMWVLVFAGANPFETVPAEAIAVDIVSENEIGTAVGDPDPPMPTPGPDVIRPALSSASTPSSASAPSSGSAPSSDFALKTQPAPSKAFDLVPSAMPPMPPAMRPPAAPAPPAPPARRSTPPDAGQLLTPLPGKPFALLPAAASLTTPREPEPETIADPAEPDFTTMFGMPLTLPDGRLGGGFDAPAITTANLAQQEASSFREHLRGCAILPESIASSDKVRIVLRVAFKADGTLAASPSLIEGTASTKGPALMQAAIKALRRCQPYTMLPSDKYKEWKVLDLSFTPQDLAGG